MFLRIKQPSLLLGKLGSSDNFLYIPISDIEKMEESDGDVTIYYRKFNNHSSLSVVARDATVGDLLSGNIITPYSERHSFVGI